MGCIRSPQTDSDLDDIWYYLASESGSLEIADRLIDSITEQFVLLAGYLHAGWRRYHSSPSRCHGSRLVLESLSPDAD
jgi:plasmid stabilization system protein ParE